MKQLSEEQKRKIKELFWDKKLRAREISRSLHLDYNLVRMCLIPEKIIRNKIIIGLYKDYSDLFICNKYRISSYYLKNLMKSSNIHKDYIHGLHYCDLDYRMAIDEDIYREWLKVRSLELLSKKYDMTREGVRLHILKYCNAYNINYENLKLTHKNLRYKIEDKIVEQVTRLFYEGLTTRDISKKLNISDSIVAKVIHDRKLVRPSYIIKRKNNKINYQDIIQEFRDNVPYKVLAEKYNVAYDYIASINYRFRQRGIIHCKHKRV